MPFTQAQQKFFNALPYSWQEPLQPVCAHKEIETLITFLKEQEAAGAVIYPAKQNIFAALQATPFDTVKVVIIGQDPYHGPGQAHGLSFSVPRNIPLPPSLRNIYKELQADLQISLPSTGTLTRWADQGVLLLNSVLTVEESKPASHANKGWEFFTDAVVQALLMSKKPIVFLLWGAYAQKKMAHLARYADKKLHLFLKAAHPSPLSIRGFLGCRHFSQTNNFLTTHNLTPIDWS